MTTFIQLRQGSETRTLIVVFTPGSGWTTKCYVTWKGEYAGELSFSDASWFSTESECKTDMERRAMEMTKMHWV